MSKTITVGGALTGILLLLIIAAAFEASVSLTGRLTDDLRANLSVESVYGGQITYLIYNPQENIEQYTTRINISAVFKNTGSVPYSTRILVLIQDFNASTNFSRMFGGYNYIIPGNEIIYSTRYTPVNWGWQWIHIMVPYGINDSSAAEAWALIYVKPYYYPWPSEPPNGTSGGGGSGGGGGGSGYAGAGGGGGESIRVVKGDEYELIVPSDGSADSGVVGFQIAYPKRVSITPGGSSVAYIIANNTGTMMLRNLMVTGYITGARMDVNPKMIYQLPGKNTTIFMITLEAPEDISPDTYFFDFRVLSNRANASGRIYLDIGEMRLDDTLNQAILNYLYIATRMGIEVEDLELQGKNMMPAKQYLTEARTLLKKARDDFELEDYEAVQDKLKRVKQLLILTANEIALARSEGALIALSPASLLIIILIIAAIVAGVALYMHKKKKEKEARQAQELNAVAAGF